MFFKRKSKVKLKTNNKKYLKKYFKPLFPLIWIRKSTNKLKSRKTLFHS